MSNLHHLRSHPESHPRSHPEAHPESPSGNRPSSQTPNRPGKIPRDLAGARDFDFSCEDRRDMPALALRQIGTPAAARASLTKRQAAHEAGHAWAAYRMGLELEPITISLIGSPLRGQDNASTAFAALAGLMAEGVATVADTYFIENKGIYPDFGPGFTVTVPPGAEANRMNQDQLGRASGPHFRYCTPPMSAHIHDPNLYWQWTQKALFTGGCTRGGDKAATHLLLYELDCTTNLRAMLQDWDRIESLARRLVPGDVLSPEQVTAVLKA